MSKVDKNFDQRRVRLYLSRVEKGGPTVTMIEMAALRAKHSREWAKWVIDNVPFLKRSDRHDPCSFCGHGWPEHYSLVGPCSKVILVNGKSLRCACVGRLLYSRGVPHGYDTQERRDALARAKEANEALGDGPRRLGWTE